MVDTFIPAGTYMFEIIAGFLAVVLLGGFIGLLSFLYISDIIHHKRRYDKHQLEITQLLKATKEHAK